MEACDMAYRTPLARVRGLGSAKSGADHFWKQRLTAVANIALVAFLIWLVVKLAGADYATAKRTLAKPHYAIPLLLLILSGVIHMRLGMQTIIEDYVHSEGRKVVALMLNLFFCVLVGLTCAFAVLKLSFGA
jgi:succinate dehydrogenase / fumarate reductase membrane anchor subunit